ncbi:MAG: divalent-cation tolerance protein CutA [Candidatus Bathyarchaeia archaeon]|nr:divalent-cation tolerance protein CutA [Candidatus Bathyarchaeota archaeon]
MINLQRHPIVVLVTTSDKKEAERISHSLLNEKLIACANIIGPVHSLFRWAGKIEKVREYVVLMKSRSDLFEKLSERVKALHTYDVPEIIALPIGQGSLEYLKWIDSSLELPNE